MISKSELWVADAKTAVTKIQMERDEARRRLSM
jgi:hypothetical protein